MNPTTESHRKKAPQSVRCVVVTVSDTRTPATDRGGALIEEMLTSAGHKIVHREIVPDEPVQIRALLESYNDPAQVEAILITGGTGIASRDQTFETVQEMLTKVLPGYGELFRMLSFEEIGAAAMLSRAIGGVMGSTVMLSMPGSPAAVRLAMEKLILPELGHLVHESRK